MKIYQVDTFTTDVLSGNPAAVIPLEKWLSDNLLQKIARENNLSETVYFVPDGEAFHIRWFTPTVEVPLCGHATLASAFVLKTELGYTNNEIIFKTNSRGDVRVTIDDELYSLDFPKEEFKEVGTYPNELISGLGVTPQKVFKGIDYVVLLKNENQVRAVQPDLSVIKTIDTRGVIVTAPGDDVDFVSRFFSPQNGIDEDPVTGSAHCLLAPIWESILNKKQLSAKQISLQGGELRCLVGKNRVFISGKGVLYMKGEIFV